MAVTEATMTLSTEERERLRSSLLPGGYGRGTFAYEATEGYVPYARSGHGCFLVDDRGVQLIDVNNNMTVNVHGNAHPEIIAAVQEQMSKGLMSLGISNETELDLAKTLIDRIWWAEQVRFANSGTEAVMLAARIARASTGRDTVLILEPSYHGTSDVVLPSMGAYGERGVPKSSLDSSLRVTPHDLSELEAAFSNFGRDIAGVILDLCSGRTGLVPLSQEYVDRARQLADEAGAMLIIDEVVTFRSALAGLHSTYEVVPDLLVLGKSIGGGLPIGAVVGNQESMGELNAGRAEHLEHGGTFTANPLTMAAGTAALRLFDAAAIDRLNGLGERLEHLVTPGASPYGWNFRRVGSVFRMVPDVDGNAAKKDAQKSFYQAAFCRNVLSTGSGLSCLSTPMDESIIDQIASSLIEAAQATSLR
jgi:glutamate-1-semialdehyde 2,1-aminomutase